MPPPAIVDPASLDVTRVIFDHEEIRRVNPHRHEFALLDAVVLFDTEQQIFAAYHDIRPDAWWCRAHIPGRPLYPGVLMIESAAQLASFVSGKVFDNGRFIGLTSVEDVKFRGAVEPPCRLVIAMKAVDVRPRRTKCAAQAFVDNTMVFQATITGMPL